MTREQLSMHRWLSDPPQGDCAKAMIGILAAIPNMIPLPNLIRASRRSNVTAGRVRHAYATRCVIHKTEHAAPKPIARTNAGWPKTMAHTAETVQPTTAIPADLRRHREQEPSFEVT